MIKFVRAVVGALALFAAAPAFAETDITGWWRADIEHNGETEPLYFHFAPNAEGAPRLRFSVPVARMHEVAGGPYEVAGDQLTIPGFGLTFTLSADASAFDGVLPPTFVSMDPAPVHFVRSDAAPTPAEPAPRGEPPAPAWTVNAGAPIWAGLVADGTRALFVANEHGVVSARSPRDGVEIWRADLGAGVYATPTLRGRRLYVATDQALVALDARTGREIWRSAPFGAERAPRLPITDANSKWDHYSSSAAVDDRLAVVGSRDGCVHALNVRDGSEVWRSCTEDLITATPLLTADAVYYASYDGRAYAASRTDGRELWRYDTRSAIPRDVVQAGDAVIVGSRSFDLIALDRTTGQPRWSRLLWYSWIDSPPVFADGRLYLGTSDAVNVFAFDARTGARIWATPVPGWTWPRVAVSRDTVFAGVVGGAYSAPRVGGFAAIGRADGTLLWLYPAARAEGGALYGFAAGPVVSGRRVFAADLNGQVYAFDLPRR